MQCEKTICPPCYRWLKRRAFSSSAWRGNPAKTLPWSYNRFFKFVSRFKIQRMLPHKLATACVKMTSASTANINTASIQMHAQTDFRSTVPFLLHIRMHCQTHECMTGCKLFLCLMHANATYAPQHQRRSVGVNHNLHN